MFISLSSPQRGICEYTDFFTDYRRLTTIFANVNLQVVFAMIFRKFPENINKTLIAARPLSARDSRNVLCLFGFGVVDKKMFYTSHKYSETPRYEQKLLVFGPQPVPNGPL